jgi:hypothetical protein
MEFAKAVRNSPDHFKLPHDTTALLQSPNAAHERSTFDISRFSNPDSTLHFTPIGKHRNTVDSNYSPNVSSFSLSDKKHKPKSHSLLEEQLMKIEQEHSSSRNRSKDEGAGLRVEPEIGVYAEDYEEHLEDYGKGNRLIPTLMWCAYCKGEMVTKVVYVNTTKTFMSSLGIFFSGGFLGCFMIPYVTNCCKGVQMTCKKCGRVLG